jgi:uncharacterized membrane protein
MSDYKKTYNQIAGQRLHRIEAISNGVFAISITLLVRDLKVPVSPEISTEVGLVNAFVSLVPQLLSYFLSFMTLGIFWTAHTTQFHYINKSDRHLNWISLFFLMFVTLLPFTTAFLSEYINFKFAIGLYWLNIVALGMMLFIQWRYVYRHNYLGIADDEKKIVNKAIKQRLIVSHTLYTIGALFCFINTYLSVLIMILIQLNFALAIFFKPSKREDKIISNSDSTLL